MSENKIVTLTLNPTLDRTLVTRYLALGYHNRTIETTRLDPAGRGVNVARSLHALKSHTHSIVLLGDDGTGLAYEALVKMEGFPVTIVHRQGLTRSNVIIIDSGNETETLLIEESTGATEETLQRVTDAVEQVVKEGDIVVLAGSLPNDAPPDIHARLTEQCHSLGAQVALSIPGDLLNEAFKGEPDLVMLTQLEVEGLFNYPVRTRQDMVYCGRQLQERGINTLVIVESEYSGILLVDELGIWRADFPADRPLGSRGGVKESVLAGFLAARLDGQPPEKSLGMGVAAAAYAIGQVGYEFASQADVQEINSNIEVTPAEEV